MVDGLAAELVGQFAHEAERALAAGIPCEYRTVDRTLPFLRGRLRLRDQELRRFGRPTPLAVTVIEPTVDTADYRRLRATVRQLAALPDLPPALAARLGRLDRTLDAATPHALLRSGHLDRLGRAHALAELALNEDDRFKRLVTRLLTAAASGTGHQVLARPSYPLDTLGRHKLEPDIVVIRGTRMVACLDVRDQPCVTAADLHRLLAYCTCFGLGTAHLLCPSGQPKPEPYDIASARLLVHGIDPAQPLGELTRSVHKLFLKLARLQPATATA